MDSNDDSNCIVKKYSCDKCDYCTSNKYDFKKHLSTRKHKNAINDMEIVAVVRNWVCKCGKKYKYDSGYYRHKKNCTFTEESKENMEIITSEEPPKLTQELILKLVEENSEIKNMLFKQFDAMNEQQRHMQNQISELIPKVGNNNTVINNKQRFNINVFLNEQCKDAITMNEFIDKLTISLEDLFVTKNKGISEGVSNIFIKNMNKLSLHERPMHCTDVKRETVYIKSEGEVGEEPLWIKDAEKEKLKRAISDVKLLQSQNLKLYTDKNPDWIEESNKQDEYMLMVKNCLDDLKDNIKQDKVIRKVCTNTYLNGEK